MTASDHADHRQTDIHWSAVIGRHLPLLLTLVVLSGAVGLFLVLTIHQNEGHLVYALDDPYIHMAMAKNLTQHGVWGVTSYEFSSSSSSLLWTLLLALTYLPAGPNEITPLLLNLLSATALVITLYYIAERHGVSPLRATILLLAVVFIAPLPLLIFGGQEHVLHALLTVSFVYLAGGELADEHETRTDPRRAVLLIVSSLVVMARYEGLFVVGVAALLLILRRRLLLAFGVAGAGGLPVVVYGLISMAHGWYVLPNSVLLKGNRPELTSPMDIVDLLGYAGYTRLVEARPLMMLALGALLLFHLLFLRDRQLWRRVPVMMLLFLGALLLHVQFADTGWFFRYDAYLVVLGILVIGVALQEIAPTLPRLTMRRLFRHSVLAAVIVFMAVSPVRRGRTGLTIVLPGTDNIYEQQYQMGLFLRSHYQGQTVAVNDIGAVSYLADVRTLDLWGLANVDVAAARLAGEYDTDWIQSYVTAQDADVVMVYDTWFEHAAIGGIPATWIKVGKWTIPNRVVAGGDTVSFYALTPADAETLAANLRAFAPRLPPDVIQAGRYVDEEVAAQ